MNVDEGLDHKNCMHDLAYFMQCKFSETSYFTSIQFSIHSLVFLNFLILKFFVEFSSCCNLIYVKNMNHKCVCMEQ